MVVGTLRLTGELARPDPRLPAVAQESAYMGQSLHNPPSVEGWQTGRDWINSGSVVNRINFVAKHVGDTTLPGVRRIVERVAASNGASLTPEALVDGCVDLMGPLTVSEETRAELVAHAAGDGPVAVDGNGALSQRVGEMLALIAATPEYQFG